MVSDYQNADELKKIIVPFSAHFRSLYQLLGWQSGRVESGLKKYFPAGSGDGLLEVAWVRHSDTLKLKRLDGRCPPEDDVASRPWFKFKGLNNNNNNNNSRLQSKT